MPHLARCATNASSPVKAALTTQESVVFILVGGRFAYLYVSPFLPLAETRQNGGPCCAVEHEIPRARCYSRRFSSGHLVATAAALSMEFASGCGRKRAPIILSTRRTLVRARRLFLSFFFPISSAAPAKKWFPFGPCPSDR